MVMTTNLRIQPRNRERVAAAAVEGEEEVEEEELEFDLPFAQGVEKRIIRQITVLR